jgi:hypothetical protein
MIADQSHCNCYDRVAVRRAYGIGAASVRIIVLFPFVLVPFYGLFIALPPTRSIALLLLEEDHLIEILTFAFLLVGGILGLALAWRAGRRRGKLLVAGFYLLFSSGLLFAAMEEVAWGQRLLGYETPPALEEVNEQQEVTLHNIEGLHGHTEFFRVAFGLGGLIGVWFSHHQRFRDRGIRAPVVLLPWFLVIAVLAGVDLYNDYFSIQEQIDAVVHRMSELTEMLIGISGFLFVWLNARMLSPHSRRDLS